MRMKQPDIFKKLRRGPQIITWKDASLIAGFTGVSPGYRVVDAGTGSGFLAIFLGNIVKPDGRVFTYERRKEFAKIAESNIRKAGLDDVVVLKEKDIFDGIDENDIDLITLDLPEPWHAVEHAVKSLKENAFIVSYVPNMEQVKKFVKACEEAGMRHEMTVECMLRELLVREKATRPQNKGVMHTAYISFVRKVKHGD